VNGHLQADELLIVTAIASYIMGPVRAAAAAGGNPLAQWLETLRRLRTNWVSLTGFVLVIFTYLGVNVWISGLHSYKM